jgi:hypothetical protein
MKGRERRRAPTERAPVDPDALISRRTVSAFDVTSPSVSSTPAHEGRNEVRNLEAPERHPKIPAISGTEAAQRAGEAPDEDPQRSHFDEGLAGAGNEVRVLDNGLMC